MLSTYDGSIIEFAEVEKKIQYFDSLGGTDRRKLQGLLEYLKDEWRAKKGGEMDVSEWKLVECTPDTPRQLNGKLCIVIVDEFSQHTSHAVYSLIYQDMIVVSLLACSVTSFPMIAH